MTQARHFSLNNLNVVTFDVPALYQPLLHDHTPEGPAYWQAVYEHAKEITSLAFNTAAKHIPPKIAIIDVPRGGVPVGHGVSEAFKQAAVGKPEEVRHRSSYLKTDPTQLYHDLPLEGIDLLVIADGVIATGKTIIQHLEQIDPAWKGQILIVGNATAELGIEKINEYAAQNGLKLELVTGRIYSKAECDYVDLGGKQVYFVGMEDGIPDFGDKVSAAAPKL